MYSLSMPAARCQEQGNGGLLVGQPDKGAPDQQRVVPPLAGHGQQIRQVGQGVVVLTLPPRIQRQPQPRCGLPERVAHPAKALQRVVEALAGLVRLACQGIARPHRHLDQVLHPLVARPPDDLEGLSGVLFRGGQVATVAIGPAQSPERLHLGAHHLEGAHLLDGPLVVVDCSPQGIAFRPVPGVTARQLYGVSQPHIAHRFDKGRLQPLADYDPLPRVAVRGFHVALRACTSDRSSSVSRWKRWGRDVGAALVGPLLFGPFFQQPPGIGQAPGADHGPRLQIDVARIGLGAQQARFVMQRLGLVGVAQVQLVLGQSVQQDCGLLAVFLGLQQAQRLLQQAVGLEGAHGVQVDLGLAAQRPAAPQWLLPLQIELFGGHIVGQGLVKPGPQA